MPLVAVQYPKEKWKKVNVSKFLKKFQKIEASALVQVPGDQLAHFREVLERNGCKITLLPVAHLEKDIVHKFHDLIQDIKEGRTQPKQLADFAAKTMADESLQDLDEELADLLHDAMDFEDNPSVILLNEMEEKIREIEKRLP